MSFKTSVIAALTTSAFLASSGAAVAATPNPDDFVGKRLTVDVQQLLFYDDPSKSYVGSLQRGQSFKVSRLSPSGVYAYGTAYGKTNRAGWVKTSGLDEKSAPAAGRSIPRVIGTPSARYTFATSDDFEGRYLSIAVVFRTDRALDRDKFATIAATKLRTGQTLPDGLFGGIKPFHVGDTSKNCYVVEATQVGRRTTLSNPRWKFALRDNSTVIGAPVKNITLKRQTSEAVGRGWELVAAERLGC